MTLPHKRKPADEILKTIGKIYNKLEQLRIILSFINNSDMNKMSKKGTQSMLESMRDDIKTDLRDIANYAKILHREKEQQDQIDDMLEISKRRADLKEDDGVTIVTDPDEMEEE